MNQNINFVKIIETTKGDLKVDEVIGSFKHILMHQILSPVFNQGQPLPSNRPVNLQNYSFHLNKPLTLQNASLTAGLIDHQLQNLVQASGCTHNQILIMDGSRYEQKLVQLYDKYTIVKGYTYRLGGNQIAEVLLSYEHILKQIEYEFKLGNGKFKPGYIGEIQLSQTQQINMYFSAFKAYLTFSERTGCPIIINSLQLGQKAVSVQQGGHKNTINKSEFSSQLFSIWQKVISLQTIVKPLKQSKIVLYNIPLIFESHIDQQSFTHRTYCKVHEQVLQLLQEHSIYLGFDLLRYSQVKYAIDYIALLANNFPTKIILSNGLKYKTDLTSFSGEGYLLNSQKSEISQLYKWVSNILKGQNIFKQVIFENKWRLLTWKSKAEQLQIVATWDCNKCGLVQSEKIEKFRKFGKQFCSIKCLKSYNA